VDAGFADGGAVGGTGEVGTKIIVSILQCGQSTVRVSPRPKPLASNSMLPLQYWQRQVTKRGGSSDGLLMAAKLRGKIYFRQLDFGQSTDKGWH
jgi:hypothetical protein